MDTNVDMFTRPHVVRCYLPIARNWYKGRRVGRGEGKKGM
jgi:hypothetical protein